MSAWSDHLLVLPIVLPIAASGIMLLLDERRSGLKAAISLATATALLVTALALAWRMTDTPEVYRLGNWAAPYGIVLVADRLSAMMLMLTGVLGLAALVFAVARWDRAGPRFHALFLLLLMGVNGAFLTGDLFNLFVFFEVMLAASYGLVLHGSGEARIRAGLAYIAVNLIASLFFLVGVSLVYGTMGTLNMADLARRLSETGGGAGLFEAGCAVLGIAFLIKCSAWPLGFWLPPTYAAASPPAAAVLAILSKVGVYVVVRLSLLLFGAGASEGFGQGWLFAAGLATIAYGTLGILGARDLMRAAAYAVMISSGTVLAALGTGNRAALSGALFYLVGSTLAAGALFLLGEILQRGRDPAAASLAVFADEYRDPFDDEGATETGRAIPAAVAIVGGAFLFCALMLAGLPPLAGFVGKLAMFSGLAAGAMPPAAWAFILVLTLSSLGTLMPLVRLGTLGFWVPHDDSDPVIGPLEFAALAGLLGACLVLTLWGGAGLAYTDRTVAGLSNAAGYIGAVLGSGTP
ncbi:NAD(P)H-quinone oxidoreductase subunit 2, chloroplastic [Methylobacterium adhaesivum]|jgi:multicomponent K+:H+ antiporter subunit D|uniref:Monovalent cation/H+ antiporter subunit D n=1 Tax=Methylobacterium adhaesivum TaxID=333297 RepID=A0ABT8BGD8_9HYPH|nr:monovalent cation/H+ antiporter subunit D [Methylobacterium adhaesivum]MDN3590938.1 monovalent cation/H+ antiporter subunit D [Methylobacterium adhaesivum]GJD29673.1 NAD(P)H-quinone oxidoreductase subunit 2, chloroplastic [Methylobacterium adhaesivum]